MKIACVSISRSDWNALGMVAMALREQGVHLHVFANQGHEAPEMIEADGFRALIGPMDENYDMVVLVGDRYQTLLGAAACARGRVPVAHLAGGDITEGSTDDSYRHAITKLAHLHFPTHDEAAQRIRQMGEEPWRVFEYGSASIDRIRATPLLSREETLAAVGLPADANKVILLNWQSTGVNHHRGLLAALGALDEFAEARVVAVGANDDPGGASVNELLADLARDGRIRFARNVTSQVYLSLMRWSSVLIGNSSSAYYEAPMLGCPAVDIGNRQQGRPQPGSMLKAVGDAANIADRMRILLAEPRKAFYSSPFGDGHAAPKIAASIIEHAADRQRVLRKRFVDAA
jgi:UDP-hydrolysing UDP-N-acetyl-D-glucosamine 2-epimerase